MAASARIEPLLIKDLALKVDKLSMTTVNSNFPANLFSSAPTFLPDTPGGSQINLLPEQRVQATVVEAVLNRTIVEINRHHYLAQGGRELQAGQKINLQVLQTQPRLEFKVLSNYLNDRLSQTLPLLTRSFDWSQLISQLRQLPEQGLLPQGAGKIYSQLQQILDPVAAVPVVLKENIGAIEAQLRQLMAVAEVTSAPASQQLILQHSQKFAAPSKLSPVIIQLIKNLQNQLSLLPKQPGQKLPKSWYVETRNLLVSSQRSRELSQLLPSQRQPLMTVLRQIQQHPGVSPQLSGEVKRVLSQMERQIVQDVARSDIATEVVAKQNPVVALDSGLNHPLLPVESPSGAKGTDALVQLSANLRQLLTQLPQGEAQQRVMEPELLGRLEGLLAKLQQFPRLAGAVPVSLPGYEMIVAQLEQLVAQRPATPQGHLGLLSQLLGLSLEAELSQGQEKAVLASLKFGLLGLQKELGAAVEEPLHRLELFQLCRAKLAEEQVQFLPLPFNELEEGYLLAEKRADENEDDPEGKSPLQMSLSLRLSALGNLRIDMLYEEGGLHLRLAGEDRGKMDYLQSCTGELKESLQAVDLQGVSFSADAQLPARQLRERLLPDSSNILDARI